jgi:beta-lactamase class A
MSTKGRAEDTCRCARRLEASRAAAANQGVRAVSLAKDAAAKWMTEPSPPGPASQVGERPRPPRDCETAVLLSDSDHPLTCTCLALQQVSNVRFVRLP